MSKKTLVIGASENPSRYSFKAINSLSRHGNAVVALGRRAGQVAGIPISTELEGQEDVNTVTLYVNSTHQKQYYDHILALKPERIIFNPGTENAELWKMAKENNIEPIEACTLVMLATGTY